MSTGSSPLQNPFAGTSLEHRLAELAILYEVSRALQRTLSQKIALHIILVGVTAGPGLGFNRAFILLVDEKQKALKGRLAIGPESPEAASVIWTQLKQQNLGEMLEVLDESKIGLDRKVNEIVSQFRIALEEDHTLIKIMRSHEVGRAERDVYVPQGFPVDSLTCEMLGSKEFAVAPLFRGQKDLGLLIADNAITRRPIATANMRLLQIFAQEASTAIENTLLYQQLREQVALHEKANEALRSNQERLLRAERLSTMGRMAALLAHEIRTPLVSIGGFARRLLRACPGGDPRYEEMRIIVSEVARLERLVMEVLGYSKMAKPTTAACDANALIESVVNNMREEIERNLVTVKLELAPNLQPAVLDDAQVRQALLNLVNNALDAMPYGGALTISTSADAEFLDIGVHDTGMGILKEHWDKMFTPFFTTKSAGTGLGLVIVSQVVDNHQGSLRFESQPGKGTSFYLRFPFSPGSETP
jgi:signal transduction histidine kinase